MTVTTPKSSVAPLVKQLKNAGLTFTETALRGAFHLVGRSEEAVALIQLLTLTRPSNSPRHLDRCSQHTLSLEASGLVAMSCTAW